jgi:hypothetical protein
MASQVGSHTSDIEIALNPRSNPVARSEAAALLEARHGQRAGTRAFLLDGSVVKNPAFYGTPAGLVDVYDEADLDSATGRSR